MVTAAKEWDFPVDLPTSPNPGQHSLEADQEAKEVELVELEGGVKGTEEEEVEQQAKEAKPEAKVKEAAPVVARGARFDFDP